MQSKRYCLTCDLKDDPQLIEKYKDYHKPGAVWPEILESIRQSGIEIMEIYLTGNRLFMIMEVNEQFDFDAKAQADAGNQRVQDWEELMWDFQQALPWAKEGEKWVLMEQIFNLST